MSYILHISKSNVGWPGVKEVDALKGVRRGKEVKLLAKDSMNNLPGWRF